MKTLVIVILAESMITLHFKAFMLMHIMNFFLSMLINFLRKTHEFVDDAFVDVNGDDNFSFFVLIFWVKIIAEMCIWDLMQRAREWRKFTKN